MNNPMDEMTSLKCWLTGTSGDVV